MITKRSEAIERLETYKAIIECLINKPAKIAFGKHDLDVCVQDIELTKITGLKNAPDKVTDIDGKKRTPMMFTIKTEEGDLFFLFDKTVVVGVTNGVRFIVGDYHIDIRLEA